MSNVRSIATDAASAIVERLIGNKPDQASVTDAVDQSLKR
jgi:F-type H+-transporting ATPase subunit b